MKIENVNVENYEKQKEITDKIDDLFRILGSSGNHALSHHQWIYKMPEFTELVKMGDKIINYIFHKGIFEGWNWEMLLLLSKLTENAVLENSRGNILKMIKDWLLWYLESDYYKKN